MKNSILIITTVGLWCGLASSAGAQQLAATAAESPSLPAQDSPNDSGFSPMVTPDFAGAGQSLPGYAWTATGRAGESAASVVTFKTPEQATLDETAADLNILSFIFSQNLERALGSEGGDLGNFKLGIPLLLQTEGRAVEASYIEGFGALFNLKVRFPLVPPAVPDKDGQTNAADSEWERARRALAGANQPEFRRPNPNENARPYNPKLVETLKKRVLELLRNASHLRHVQPDEWIAVTFSGPPNGLSHKSRAVAVPVSAGLPDDSQAPLQVITPPADPTGATTLIGVAANRNQASVPQTRERVTVMTIRIKKKDADSYAADKISEDQFFHAAEITTYLGPIVVNEAASDYFRLLVR
jgi:hypothetical protein